MQSMIGLAALQAMGLEIQAVELDPKPANLRNVPEPKTEEDVHHAFTGTCSQCGRIFRTEDGLFHHKREYHGARQ